MTDERFVSYAQNLEDVMLWRALRDEVGGSGFYIDVGAAGPTALSVTRAFYERGWRGLHVEPLPEQAARLRAARPEDVVIEAAVGAAEGVRPFYRVELVDDDGGDEGATGLSSLDAEKAAAGREAGAVVEELSVPVLTLAAVCREHVAGPVHFLKIDVEGAEGDVLAGADLVAVRPWIIVVEAVEVGGGSAGALPWEPGLLSAGYGLVWFDGLNRFYLAEERAGLARHFTAPPNVFDNFAVYDHALWSHVETVEAESALRLRTALALQAEVGALRRAAVRTALGKEEVAGAVPQAGEAAGPAVVVARAPTPVAPVAPVPAGPGGEPQPGGAGHAAALGVPGVPIGAAVGAASGVADPDVSGGGCAAGDGGGCGAAGYPAGAERGGAVGAG